VPRIFYRLVKHDPPIIDDMLSHGALGKPCPRPDPKSVHEWQGTSVFDTEQAARALGNARLGRPPRDRLGWERIGPFIAVLHIPDDAPIIYEGPSGPGHWLLYDGAGLMLTADTARVLLDYVDRILRGPPE